MPIKNKSVHIVLLFLCIVMAGCKDDEEFMFDINHLTDTKWGIPMVIEPGNLPFDLDAPTIFTMDGLVQIGPSRTDFWSKRGSRGIFLEQAREIWFIIDLSEDRLYVEKITHPEGNFIVKCIYEPMD